MRAYRGFEGIEGIEGLSAEAFAGTPVEEAFEEHTPDAKAFDAYLQKTKVLNVDDQNISDGNVDFWNAGHCR